MSSDHPFSAVHSSRHFLLTDALRETLARLEAGFGAREPFVLVTGEAGVGKTALVTEAIARWGDRATVATLDVPATTTSELLLAEITRRLGAEPSTRGTRPQLATDLEELLAGLHARDQVPVLVVENAHALSDELLHELRTLADAQTRAGHALEIVLVGLPSLAARLEQPGLAALRRRVSVRCGVSPLSHKDTRHYLHHRVGAAGGDGQRLFPRKTSSLIHTRASGVPAVVNQLAREAMRRAEASRSPAVTSEHVRAAANALWKSGAPPAVTESPTEHRAAKREAEPAASSAPAPAPAKSAAAPAREPAENAQRPTPENGNGAATRSDRSDDDSRSQPDAVPSDDVRVREWVTRFVGDQGPPRIGARVRWDTGASPAQPTTDAFRVTEADLNASPDPFAQIEPTPRATPPPAPRPRAPRRASAGTWHGLALGIVVGTVLATVVLLPRTGLLDRLAGTRTATTQPPPPAFAPPPVVAPAPVAAPAESVAVDSTSRPLPEPAKEDGLIPPAAPRRVPAEVTVPASSVAPVISRTRAADRADTVVPRGTRYTIEVAGLVDARRADRERDRLSTDSGLDGWVLSIPHEGVHFVLLGVFSTERRAEAAASLLVSRGVLTQARVVPLPPRKLRR